MCEFTFSQPTWTRAARRSLRSSSLSARGLAMAQTASVLLRRGRNSPINWEFTGTKFSSRKFLIWRVWRGLSEGSRTATELTYGLFASMYNVDGVERGFADMRWIYGLFT
eukprot:602749-Amorphochlora_amoeboformis.AAC.1